MAIAKGSKDDPTILLNENGKIISDQKDVCNVFNDFFINVAKDIGSNNDTSDFTSHPSINKIHENQERSKRFFHLKQAKNCSSANFSQMSSSSFKTRNFTTLPSYKANSVRLYVNVLFYQNENRLS